MLYKRRDFLLATAALGTPLAPRMTGAAPQSFKAGIVPAGKASGDALQTFQDHAAEVSALGFHHVEVNNTRARIAESYAGRVAEFKDRMASLGVRLSGLALFSHMAQSGERGQVVESHMVLGHFLQAVGGRYITHMIAPAAPLNEPDDDSAYAGIDLKLWASNATETGKRLLGDCGVALAYHPEQGEIRTGLYKRILEAVDERYLRFLPDTGHLAAGGGDALDICKKYRSRLAGVHLKDYLPGVADAAKARKPGNVPLGEGVVDFKGIIQFLGSTGFTGYVMGESGGTNLHVRDYMVDELGLTV